MKINKWQGKRIRQNKKRKEGRKEGEKNHLKRVQTMGKMLYFFNVRMLNREPQKFSARMGLFFTKSCCSFFVLLTRN